jgi:hypothetical protein
MLETHKTQEIPKSQKQPKQQKPQKHQKSQRQVQKKPVLKTSICYDLCSTCIHAEYCSYPRDLVTPVHQCEEFSDRVEVASTKVSHSVSAADFSQTKVDDDREEPTGLKGLCVDCVDRKTCQFPKAEGGVWYCEEYA